ncbi:hypothetical protein [Rubritalea tangerina]
MFTDRGLEEGSGAQPRSAVGCSVLLANLVITRIILFNNFSEFL